MTDISAEISWIGLCWLVILVLVCRRTARSRDGTVGLPMAFLFSTTFLYCGAFVYAVPGYSHVRAGGDLYLQSYQFTEETVLLGTLATVMGIAGFALGCWLSTAPAPSPQRRSGAALQIGRLYRTKVMWGLGLFAFCGFLLNGVSLPIPMLQALAQVARNVAVAIICLGAALTVLVDRRGGYGVWMAVGCTIPAAYVILWGFTSYGFVTLTVYAGFWLGILAPKRLGAWRIGVGAALITYLLLSLFVAWMSFREELRAVLWSNAGFNARLGAVLEAFDKTELLQSENFESLDLINGRLNQYIFVGKAIQLHEQEPDLQMDGETLLLALVAWVPRILWPGKPEMGGSGFVAKHTGLQFAEGATFGGGPVFEFYVNFNYAGVFFGFALLGIVLCRIDRSASRALRQGRLLDFIRCFTTGLALIAPLTDLFFIVNTATMSWLVLTGFKMIFESRGATGIPVRGQLAGRAPRGNGMHLSSPNALSAGKPFSATRAAKPPAFLPLAR